MNEWKGTGLQIADAAIRNEQDQKTC